MALTPKQEKFCLVYVETGNASEAYRQAYDAENMKPETLHVKACELLKQDKVSVRVGELQAAHRERHEVTIDGLAAKLEAALNLAMKEKQASAAVQAISAMAKLLGVTEQSKSLDFPLPDITDSGSALAALSAVVAGVAKGALTAEQGRQLSGLIENYRRMLETAELERRLVEIEKGLNE